MRKWFKDIFYSFPFQLLILHLRSNLILLAIWIVLALFIAGDLAFSFGLKYLFLSPEYLGKVGFWSFFFLGFGFGAMLMSWNLTTYLLSAQFFPFLASLARPFTKFCINNFLVPAAFIVLFFICLVNFEIHYESLTGLEALKNSLAFLFGIASLVLLIAAYFNYTNKDILSYVNPRKHIPPHLMTGPGKSRGLPDFEAIKANRNQWRVDTYLTDSFKPRLVRSVAHYDIRLLFRVFKQNHTNALMVQLFSLVILVALGYLIDRPAFRIPAGASIFLLSSIVIAITGAISYWFQRWRMLVLFLLFVLINQITRYDFLHHKNKAYGLNYNIEKADYSLGNLKAICSPENVEEDLANTTQILNNWKSKNETRSEEKPKMIFYCVSGGGLKSATWAMKVLQYGDEITHGEFMKHTVLMSGASGGMLGTSYFRELYLENQTKEAFNIYDSTYVDDISKDLLNSIAFTIISNDLFMPWVSFEKGGFNYKKDRGYIFEKQFNENTSYRLDKTLADYKEPEKEAIIPLTFITPSVVNDGRRMIISSQGVSYMMAAPVGIEVPNSVGIDAIDFGRLFDAQKSNNIQFTTILRMNATYPYILPNVFLPCTPRIEVMDAGFRDNFGLKTATRFIHVFQDWISENTSGVVFVIVRAFDRKKLIKSSENEGIFESVFNPLGIAGKIMTLQDFEHDTNLGFIYDILGKQNTEIIRFTYRPGKVLKDGAASISFHLTNREKRDIIEAVHSDENQESFRKLKGLLIQ